MRVSPGSQVQFRKVDLESFRWVLTGCNMAVNAPVSSHSIVTVFLAYGGKVSIAAGPFSSLQTAFLQTTRG